MNHRFLGSISALAVAIAAVWLMSAAVAAQAPSPGKQTPGAKKWTPPRTPDGQPDLQGVWDFRTVTPMERPADLAGKEVFSDEEAAEFERRTNELQNRDRRDGAGSEEIGPDGRSDLARAYNDFWWDRGTSVIATKRTSLIVEPADGKIPGLTPEGQARDAERAERRARPAVGPEDRSVGERCLLGFNAGPPMVPSAYNNNVQIVQNRDYVVLLNEMVHDARIVPLDGRPHVAPNIRQWKGDSRGRWEGDTLVVDTRNYLGETSFRSSGPNLHLVERFTRVAPDILLYRATLDDPATWARRWTFEVPMTRNTEPLYEYACHEGNYGMTGILEGARAVEKAAEDAARKQKSEN